MSKEREEALNTKRAIQDLLKSPGWSILREVAGQQVKTRTDQIVLTPSKPDTIYEMEFLKGEVAGIRSFLMIPETLVETSEVTLSQEDDPEERSNDG